MTILSHLKDILKVKLLHRKHEAGYVKSWAVLHVGRELGGVECGGHQDNFKIRTFGQYLLDDNEEDVCQGVSLVDLVDDDVGEGPELGVGLEPGHEDPGGAVEDAASGGPRRFAVQPNLI